MARRSGVFVPLVTPLDRDGRVCVASVARLVASSRYTAAGYLPCLTSGEGWRLTDPQWDAMVRATVAAAGDRPVIAGAERGTTGQVMELARRAKLLGARGVMITSPFGEEVTQRSIFEHYRQVHDLGELEVYIYNESTLSRNVTALDTLLAIAELPRVVGIKDSAETPRDSAEIAELQRRGVAYLLGWEHMLGKGMPVDGNVVSLANLEPGLCRLGYRVADAAVQEEVQRVTEAYDLLAEDWYRNVKVALHERGVLSSARLADG
jgi:4-hydroxy-tetrahydrodipicolinate synthase